MCQSYIGWGHFLNVTWKLHSSTSSEDAIECPLWHKKIMATRLCSITLVKPLYGPKLTSFHATSNFHDSQQTNVWHVSPCSRRYSSWAKTGKVLRVASNGHAALWGTSSMSTSDSLAGNILKGKEKNWSSIQLKASFHTWHHSVCSFV